MERRIVTHSAQETEAAARTFAAQLRPGAFLAMYGDLGAGKTCFIRGLAAGLGCADPVSSPTFAIVHDYRGPWCENIEDAIPADAVRIHIEYGQAENERIITISGE